ncbi:4761_t:CDS:2 [Funneliformis caledonium]|uniref:4761_t:CDS:1 n=1 Tax=Funneliformis caledonium TaxID=1117310 RepID=A0A9N9H3C0_9GLOM|nr:4761_t:CDS:2 [Funneliformis caledonium]
MELWLLIVGTDYLISNIRRIKNKNGKISEGSIHKGHGYAVTKISKNNNYRSVNIHRLVAEVFIPNPENKPFVNHINGRVQLLNRMITQGSLSERYFQVGIGHLKYQVHHLVALAFYLKEQGKDYVNHIDRNPTNNKVSNLKWCTQKENMQHAISHKL